MFRIETNTIYDGDIEPLPSLRLCRTLTGCLSRFANSLVHASLAHAWGKRYETLMIGSDQPNKTSSLSSPTSQLCQVPFVDPQRVQQILSGSAYRWCRYGASLCCRITISRGFQGLQLTLSVLCHSGTRHQIPQYRFPQYRFPGKAAVKILRNEPFVAATANVT